MANRSSIFFATCFLVGFCGKAPGTVGSLLGAIAYPFTFGRLGWAAFVPSYSAAVLCAVWICGKAEDCMGERDPPQVILDEFVAMPLCYWPLEHFFAQIPMARWLFLLIGFALFRFFDICKPLAISKLQSLRGGLGIVLDDLAAAIATAFAMAVSFAVSISLGLVKQLP
ncbi:MAG: phosphatidylglycerophosphatase A [Puniceicoccales bacterium]|jgi:phosphatidylglycerophosphatase A|nr:phosphatidylglycerophosphatase A [Puniceicoccales bacterium]